MAALLGQVEALAALLGGPAGASPGPQAPAPWQPAVEPLLEGHGGGDAAQPLLESPGTSQPGGAAELQGVCGAAPAEVAQGASGERGRSLHTGGSAPMADAPLPAADEATVAVPSSQPRARAAARQVPRDVAPAPIALSDAAEEGQRECQDGAPQQLFDNPVFMASARTTEHSHAPEPRVTPEDQLGAQESVPEPAPSDSVDLGALRAAWLRAAVMAPSGGADVSHEVSALGAGGCTWAPVLPLGSTILFVCGSG